jgi:hypothetical protein
MSKWLNNTRWRHIKRGSTYTIRSTATLQCSADPKHDNEAVVIYQADDGSVWVRPADEFFDGRFEAIND